MAGFSVKVEFDEEKFHEAIEEFKKNNPDLVEVVRCKDCKWADPCICVVCEEGKTVVCGKFHMHANKDGFCSYGARKEVSE